MSARTEAQTLERRILDLEQRNRLLEAEVDRLRVYKEYAYTDVLTEVPNRRFYHERLAQEVARARRNHHALTLGIIDLDFFKDINESHGHRGGDQVLKFFAQFLRANLRQEDVLCRVGGDEFAILLPDTTADRAMSLFNRIRSKLAQIALAVDGRGRLELSFSCGVANFLPDYMVEDLIEEADHSLFTAKAKGRNRVVVAQRCGNSTVAAARAAVH